MNGIVEGNLVWDSLCKKCKKAIIFDLGACPDGSCDVRGNCFHDKADCGICWEEQVTDETLKKVLSYLNPSIEVAHLTIADKKRIYDKLCSSCLLVLVNNDMLPSGEESEC